MPRNDILMTLQWTNQLQVLRQVFLAFAPISESLFPSIFKPFLQQIYKKFLHTAPRFLEFFSYFWINPGIFDVYITVQLIYWLVEIPELLQTRAICIATLFIQSAGDIIVSWEATLFSLLIALTSQKVRSNRK